MKKNTRQYYDLLPRTKKFAQETRSFISLLRPTICNIEDSKQLARASGSVAANYIEANDAFSKKDFIYRIKICRKEAKEGVLFLSLINTGGIDNIEKKRAILVEEANQLVKIFGAIITKSTK